MVELKELSIEEEYKKGYVTPQDVAKIREWLKTQPHLPEKYITDLDIVLTYHCCKNSIEVTKQLLDLNYSLRTLFTPYFKNRRFDATLERVFKNQLFTPLSTCTKTGSMVLYTHGLNTDPNEFDIENYIKAFLLSIDVWQHETGTWPGLEVVINFEGYNVGHMPKIDLRNVQQILYYLQEAIPVNLKKLHLLNAPSFFNHLLTIMKPFIKHEMLNVIQFHTDGFKSISDHIPMEAFPKDVGGNNKTMDELNDEVIKKMRASASYLEHENKKRVVEELRPGKPKKYTDIFGGVEGSFKSLDID